MGHHKLVIISQVHPPPPPPPPPQQLKPNQHGYTYTAIDVQNSQPQNSLKKIYIYGRDNNQASDRLRYSWFCIRFSARICFWQATKRYRQCSRGYRWFCFTFLLLNLLKQEHGVNNERSQSIQSGRHFKRTHRTWPHQKDRSVRKQVTVSCA